MAKSQRSGIIKAAVDNIIDAFGELVKNTDSVHGGQMPCPNRVLAAVGVSGGVDSMCLLHLIVKAGFAGRVTVLHIDHSLRDSSVRDRQLVEQFCAKNSIKIKVFTPEIAKSAAENHRSIETEARIVRHQIFSDFCRQNDCPIFLAHNADDNVESILMHIFRGCGIGGLVGMTGRDGHIIRPLIGMAKSEIYYFAAQENIEFGEDETNKDTKFRRNHLRQVIETLENSFPSLKTSVLSLSKIAQETAGYIDSQLDYQLITRQNDTVLLDKNALNSPLKSHYVAEAIRQAGLKIDITQKHIAAVVALANAQTGKSINLPHSLVVFCQPDSLAFEFYQPPNREIIDICEGENFIANQTIIIKKTLENPQKGRIIVDSDALKGVKLRLRQDGDRFTPCGGRSKKLKQYLCDKKIPLRTRDLLPLIARDNEVLVIAGVELSDKVKITDSTKNRYEISLKPLDY